MSAEYTVSSVFAATPQSVGSGRGVVAIERGGLAIAHLAARTAQVQALRARVREHFGIELPDAARRVSARGVAAAGIAPQRWLMLAQDAGEEFVPDLVARLEPLATVVELTDAYAVLRLSGADLRASLAKIVPIDLHEAQFRPGDVAQTVLEHMPVTLWRLEDAPAGQPVFELAVAGSFAGSLYEAVRDSAAEFGFRFEPLAQR